jgi:ribonuclease E
MAKKMLIDATHAEETRVVVVDGNKVEEFDFESENKRQLAGNIYLAKVTRVEPSLQAAFVDYGGNRHGFLAFSEIHPDYYQIPVADRKALLAEERALAEAAEAEEEQGHRSSRGRNRSSSSRRNSQPARVKKDEAEVSTEPMIGSMDVIDLDGESAEPDQDHGHDMAAEPLVLSQDDAVGAPAEAVSSHHDHEHVHTDSEIESIADEDVAEEIPEPRRQRPRRYKIQEVVKVRQIMLVQVVKEERGNKGAALTTYLSLAGRYCVLMPNTGRGGGISRKITNAADRKKLKEIAVELEVPDGAGLIIRTAGAQRTKAEIKRDYEYLQRLWEQIRELTLKSIAPAKIYEEGDLIKRTIRDLYSKDIDEVLVEGEGGYRSAKDFMKMIMPSHSKNVKLYEEQMPLFARFQVESYLSSMFNPVVQLKSGGYIVIGVTEALVAIDVNSGRATKEGSIEETALKTNLEASEEIARQLRLRDLAGLIVIDFIDMEERKNNSAVEKRLKDKLKTDRARIQIGRISGFGLLEMSRQRLRPGMLEATTQPCPHCHGTGLIRSDDSLALSILRQLEEEGTRKRSREVLLKAPIGIVNFLFNQKREHVAAIELRYGMSVRIEADPMLISPDFSIEKFKTATRPVADAKPVVSGGSVQMDDLVEEEIEEDIDEAEDEAESESEVETTASETGADGQPKKKRRRRRRRKGGNRDSMNGGSAQSEEGDSEVADAAALPVPVEQPMTAEATVEVPVDEAPAKRTTRSSSRSTTSKSSRSRSNKAETEIVAEPVATPVAEPVAEVTEKPKASRSRKPKAETVVVEAPVAEAAPEPKPKATRSRKPKAEVAAAEVTPAVAEAKPEPVVSSPAPPPSPEPEVDTGPKKRGWWSRK